MAIPAGIFPNRKRREMRSNKPLVLILCGGRSLRLWPLSEKVSKNFLDIFGFSPLELTIKRFLKITIRDNIFLVANQADRKELVKLKLISEKNIFFEPASKNTAAAILLSLHHLKNYSRKNLIISPVDTLIKNKIEFYRTLKRALAAAGDGGICTLGIKPSSPTPNFGYIQVKGAAKKGIFSVKKFIEKPTVPCAKKLIASGDCFYNSGMFVATVSTLTEEYKKYYSHYKYFNNCFRAKRISSLYKRISDIPFDKAIMEKTRKAKMVKGSFYWKDFGSWSAIYEILAKDKKGNVTRGSSFIHEGKNNLIYLDSLKKKALVLGLEDIFFVDTEDFTLLTTRTHLDNLKPALKKFRQCQ